MRRFAMTRQRAKLWLAAASLFTLINLGGAGMAAVAGEGLHTAAHVGLLILGAYFVWWLTPRVRRQQMLAEQEVDPRLERIQQTLHTIGLEVERIGEAQRFTTKIVAERVDAASPKPPRDAGT